MKKKLKSLLKITKKIFFPFALFFLFILCAHPLFSENLYWENPVKLTKTDSRFPKVVSNGFDSYVLWQEIDASKEQLWLSCSYYSPKGKRVNSRFAGPLKYSGEVPDIYSAVVSPTGTLAISALSATNTISVFISEDKGLSFKSVKLPEQRNPLVAPHIYTLKNGKYILFTSIAVSKSASEKTGILSRRFFMYYAESEDGIQWSDFSEFLPVSNMRNPFSPVITSSSEGDFLIFQAQHQEGAKLSYQLYFTLSQDGAKTWLSPVLLTNTNSVAEEEEFSSYQNQKAFVYTFNDNVYAAWERHSNHSENTSIWIAKINKNGIIQGSAKEISHNDNAKRAVIFSYEDKLSLVWFDSGTGIETVYMAQEDKGFWTENKISSGKKSAMFAFPLITSGKDLSKKILSFIWQENLGTDKKGSSINILSPDTSLSPPEIIALNHKTGTHSKSKKVRYKIKLPDDSSGVAGFTYSWSTSPSDEPLADEDNLILPSGNLIEVSAEEEGKWYFKVRALDYAGNWSSTAETYYYLDTTPPMPPVFEPLSKDDAGFMNTNTFSVSWLKDNSDEDIAGYTYALHFISPIPKSMEQTPLRPVPVPIKKLEAFAQKLLLQYEKNIFKEQKLPVKIQTLNPFISWANLPNGLYVLSVAAVDTAGNVGAQAKLPLLLNKYIPHTKITGVSKKQSSAGEISIEIYGKDFDYDGKITKVYADKDGKPPYDFSAASGTFKVEGGNKISGVNLGAELDEGEYYIGLYHSGRGLYITERRILQIKSNGTVKIDSGYKYSAGWKIIDRNYKYRIHAGYFLLILIFITAFTGVINFGFSTAEMIYEISSIKYLIRQARQGEFMHNGAGKIKKRILSNTERKGSLKFQLVGFTISLVIVIINLVAVPLGMNMIRKQGETLSEGLKERIDVLLSSLASGARAYMPLNNVLELSQLPEQSNSIAEAEYATITGFSAGEEQNTQSLLYIWASNDKNISSKINTDSLIFGKSLISGAALNEINEICSELNKAASSRLMPMIEKIAKLNMEGTKLALRSDKNSASRLKEISVESQQLTLELNSKFEDIASVNSGSIPEFNSAKLNHEITEYLFFRPVLYRQGTSSDFVRGIILLKINTASLIESVNNARQNIISIVVIIAFFAIIIGCTGAVLLASVIVKPIKTLEEFVKKISDEKHKDKLAGEDKNIKITRNDEIGRLGDSINKLKEELASAAREENLANDGKAVQQAFLPLENSGQGGRRTTAELKEAKIECFGYYEGASAVSGDYFDYKKLDERWYVLIKCDASGHGVPAALIMTVVATLFRKYFEKWDFQKDGTRINQLINEINNLIESIGLKGKFAAVIVCLFDTQTGDLYMCNAGDNIVHIYDNTVHKQTVLKLAETPAAGPLPSFLVDLAGGFKVEKTNLKHGDVLFLYTDGIEESTRCFRNADFSITEFALPDSEKEKALPNQQTSTSTEQLEPERVKDIIEAVFAKRRYILEKKHNPIPGEQLIFDFTSCSGSVEDAVIALASVEKVFRMYKPPAAEEQDIVKVDKKIDMFLKKHFNLYSTYCSVSEAVPSEPNYLFYKNLMEDEQLDDLTLLAVKRS